VVDSVAGAVESLGAVESVGAPVESVGGLVEPVGSVVGAVITGAGEASDSRFGRRNHTNVAVTTTIMTATPIATNSSRRSRGGLYGTRLAVVDRRARLGLIASGTSR
jgi:hypothetical protein